MDEINNSEVSFGQEVGKAVLMAAAVTAASYVVGFAATYTIGKIITVVDNRRAKTETAV